MEPLGYKAFVELAADVREAGYGRDVQLGMGDYVIVHELLHFSVPNHGRLWKSLMRAHLGDWEAMAERLPKIARSRREPEEA